jgi:predicted metal-binding membrane protein
MTTAIAPRWRRARTARPAIIAETAIGAGWIVAIAVAPAGMHGMAHTVAAGALGLWIAMTAATMLPSALPAARHVAVNSLRRRRHRAVALFIAGFLTVWAAFGLVDLVLLAAIPVVDPEALLPGTVLIAAGWQITAMKRWALRECHRTMPLPAVGWRADVAALRFGLRNGAGCLGSCWALMLVMSCAAGPAMAWGAAIGAGAFLEKTSEQPKHLARMGALVLVLVALFTSVPLRHA